MRLRTFASLLVIALIAVAASTLAAAPLRHQPAPPKADYLSGEWDGTLTLQGTTIPVKFRFELDDGKVTGTAESEHTGPGTLSKGTWTDKKLSFTIDFAAHESIALTGVWKDDKLSGEFRTEGMQGKWEAKKKKK
jgi:hypothetical protein